MERRGEEEEEEEREETAAIFENAYLAAAEKSGIGWSGLGRGGWGGWRRGEWGVEL